MSSWVNPTSYSSSIGTVPIANGGTALTALPTSVVASTYSAWDANSNFSANSFLCGANLQNGKTLALTDAEIQLSTSASAVTWTLPPYTTSGMVGKRFVFQSRAGFTIKSGSTSLYVGVGNVVIFECFQTGVSDIQTWLYYTGGGTSVAGTGGNQFSSPLSINNGGTGLLNTSPVAGSIVWGASTTFLGYTAAGTSGQPLLSGGSAVPTWGTLGVGAGGTALTALPTASASSTFAAWNADQRIPVEGQTNTFATTATAAGTTTLTTASAGFQLFTGSTTQTVLLPVSPAGYMFTVVNSSTGTVTVKSSGANTITTLTTNQGATLICNTTSGTTAASWTWYPVSYQTSTFVSPMTTEGDLIYQSSGNPTRLAVGSSSQVLLGGTDPSWGAVALGSAVTGTLPTSNGGTGNSSGTNSSLVTSLATLQQSQSLSGSSVFLSNNCDGKQIFTGSTNTNITLPSGYATGADLTIINAGTAVAFIYLSGGTFFLPVNQNSSIVLNYNGGTISLASSWNFLVGSIGSYLAPFNTNVTLTPGWPPLTIANYDTSTTQIFTLAPTNLLSVGVSLTFTSTQAAASAGGTGTFEVLSNDGTLIAQCGGTGLGAYTVLVICTGTSNASGRGEWVGALYGKS